MSDFCIVSWHKQHTFDRNSVCKDANGVIEVKPLRYFHIIDYPTNDSKTTQRSTAYSYFNRCCSQHACFFTECLLYFGQIPLGQFGKKRFCTEHVPWTESLAFVVFYCFLLFLGAQVQCTEAYSNFPYSPLVRPVQKAD